MNSRALPRRMWRAARLEADFYEEVEAEKRSIAGAAVVVALACAAGACGSWLAGVPTGRIVVDVILEERPRAARNPSFILGVSLWFRRLPPLDEGRRGRA